MRDNITTALAGYARAQSDMAARMERSNAEINDGGGMLKMTAVRPGMRA